MPRDIKYVSPVSDHRLTTIFASVRLRLDKPEAWCKGKPRFGNAVDLGTALLDACDGDKTLYRGVRDVLDLTGHKNLLQFNDNATHEDVLELLDACAGVIEDRRREENRKNQVLWVCALVVVAVVLVFLGVM